MKNKQITLPREETLADYETLGRLRGLLDMLEFWHRSFKDDETFARQARFIADRYQQLLMNEATQDVEDPATVPFTPAEEDELERAAQAANKSRTPHEL